MSAIAYAEQVMFRKGFLVGLDGLDGHRGIAHIFDDKIVFGPVQISRDRDAAAVFEQTVALGTVEIDDHDGDVVRSRDRKWFSNDVDATRHVFIWTHEVFRDGGIESGVCRERRTTIPPIPSCRGRDGLLGGRRTPSRRSIRGSSS